MSLVQALGATLSQTLLSIIPNEDIGTICILDVPDYANVGDPAILVGEIDFFRKNFPKAKLVLVSYRNYGPEVDAEIEAADVLFLHGGGSFGDIWPAHHGFRLQMLKRFAHRTIIQLPQSLHFSSSEVMQETATAIAAVKDFQLITRDQRSFDLAARSFDCALHLSPDMAFAIGPLPQQRTSVDFLCLLRTDKEALTENSRQIVSIVEESGSTYTIADWLVEQKNVEKIHAIVRKLVKAGLSKKFLARHGAFIYETYARSRLEFGIKLLSNGRTVITDRLHGHILSTLLGKKQFVFDSMDGKIRQYNQTWLSSHQDAVFLANVSDLASHISKSSHLAQTAA